MAIQSAQGRAGEGARPSLAPTLGVDIEGGLVCLRADYDPALVEAIRALPGRRFIRERAEWTLPARRVALARLSELIESLGERARLSERAQRRLERSRLGRVRLREGEFELSFAPTPQRLAAVRALPERRYLSERRCWHVALTRASALALAALVEESDFVVERHARSLLGRLASGRDANANGEADGENGGRASPIAHWRHVVRGPIFEANVERREWVAGVGWCVRVRVDPPRRAGER